MHRAARIIAVLALAAGVLSAVASPALASVTSTVISTGDQAYSSGGLGVQNDCKTGLLHTCTLRAAITRADNNGGGAIDFDISGSGVQTIDVGSTGLGALPAITQPVTINGSTQPGWSGAPLIQIEGSSAGSSADGLDFTAGSSAATGLIVNRFGGNGISFTSGNDDTLYASYVGTDSSGGASVAGNGGAGVYVSNSYDEIGAAGSHNGNVISNNASEGVDIDGASAAHDDVVGNNIGTNPAGTAAVGNEYGILVNGAPSNRIGGPGGGTGNVISGNAVDGIKISGSTATGNIVLGNMLGTDSSGETALGNGAEGIELSSPSDTVGGTDTEDDNIISGNGDSGVLLDSGATANVVEGNRIGTNTDGTVALGNQWGIGVEDAPANIVGGTVTGAGNLISGNVQGGVGIDTSGSNELVEGNQIGTNAAGTGAISNGYGVVINGPSNVIGGTSSQARNLISGNVHDGINLYLTSATNDVVEGNYIGTNSTGDAALGNGRDGILDDEATGTLIGGTGAGAGNVIAGNANDGVGVYEDGTITVQGNLIGTDAAGTGALGQTYSGVALFSSGNTIGGTHPADRNVISGNGHWGVSIFDPSNVVQGNFIGTDVSGSGTLGNGENGVYIYQANSNTIGGVASGAGNRITGSGDDGILVYAGVFNALRGNLLYANTPKEIDLQNGANNAQSAPVLSGAASDSSSTGVAGTLTANPGVNSYSLDFYSGPACESSGAGPAETYLGSATVKTKSSGVATFLVTLPVAVAPGSIVVATATDSVGDTSELSACAAVGGASADLSLSMAGSPNPVPHGSQLTYTATVKNLGLTKATSTTFSDTLPAGVTFVSASSSQGSCSGTTTVTCSLGTVKAKKKVMITIVVVPAAPGKIVNNATVSSAVADPNLANNSAKVKTKVT